VTQVKAQQLAWQLRVEETGQHCDNSPSSWKIVLDNLLNLFVDLPVREYALLPYRLATRVNVLLFAFS
jgi:hypothetical protein